MTDTIRRTSLMVRDAEASARWYEAVFGMTRAMDTPFILSGESSPPARRATGCGSSSCAATMTSSA